MGLYSFHNPSPSGEGHFSGLALHSEELGCSRVCAESWVLPSVIGPWAPRAGTDETGCVAYLHRSLPWSLLLSALPHPTLGPEERQGISPLSQRSLWNEQCPLPQTGAKDPLCAQYPCLRQGPRTPCVPSILASDRGQGPPECPVSLPQTGAKDPPGAQQHVLQTDASKAFSVQQCAHEGGSVCLQVSPQEPETTRAKTLDLLLCRASGGGGAAGWRQPGLGEGILVTAGRREDWKSRKSQDVVRVRPYGPVLWISWS